MDIVSQYEYNRTSFSPTTKRRQIMTTLSPRTELQNVSSSADTTVPSQTGVGFLFGPMIETLQEELHLKGLCSGRGLLILKIHFALVARWRVLSGFLSSYAAHSLPILSAWTWKNGISYWSIEGGGFYVATQDELRPDIVHDTPDHARCVDTRQKEFWGGTIVPSDKLVAGFVKEAWTVLNVQSTEAEIRGIICKLCSSNVDANTASRLWL
ncbi:hypothetical protein Tco_0729471 [Tanacetum coccineum]|uniref:Uncharacterized protein n=1 Tax=Tanacetum coccineum TaxID=301880 RepID=A0ABQ4YPH1_9ASTR